MVMAWQALASEDWCSRVLLVCINDRLRSRKENGRNRIAGAGMHVKLVMTGEAVIGTYPSWWVYAIPRVGWRMCVGWSLSCMTQWVVNLVCQPNGFYHCFEDLDRLGWGCPQLRSQWPMWPVTVTQKTTSRCLSPVINLWLSIKCVVPGW